MGLLATAFSRKMTSEDIWLELYGGRKSSTGKAVNLKTAIQVSTVFACCRVIGNGMAQIPLKLLRESADGKSRMPAKDHPLYNLMAIQPNRWQTSFQWRQMMAWHVELCGDHVSYINRIGGVARELFPFSPSQVEIKDAGRGVLKYKVTLEGGGTQTFEAKDVLHIRGPSMNGFEGLEIIKMARDAIGLAMATEESAGKLHKNGVNSSGVYSVNDKLGPDQHKLLSEWIDEHYAGPNNSGKPLILDRAATWTSTQMTGIDAQALETRRYQVEEVCRFLGVMPIMVGYSDKAATYASAEQMFLAHLVHTMSPRWTNVEEALNTQLLTEKDREQGLYFDFVEEGMIRASVKDTKDTLLGYVNGGLMTPNEGRSKLDMNPDPDPESDKLRIPVTAVQVPDSAPQP